MISYTYKNRMYGLDIWISIWFNWKIVLLERLLERNEREKASSYDDYKMKKFILPIFTVIMLSIFPVMFMYFKNIEEIVFMEVAPPLLVFSLIGIIVLLICLIFTKDIVSAVLCSIPIIFVSENYVFVERLFTLICPPLKYWHIVPMLLFVLVELGYILNQKVSKENKGAIVFIICITLTVLMSFNIISAVPNIYSVLKINNEKTNTINKESETNMPESERLPNVYWLIFDEFSSKDVIQKYYDYDASGFFNYCEQKGFNVSYTSKNDTYSTSTVLANYLNLNYLVSDNMTELEKKEYRVKPLLFDLIKAKGYTLKAIGKTDFFNLDSAIHNGSNNSKAETVDGKNISYLIYKNTIWRPFIKNSNIADAKLIVDTINYLCDKSNYTDEQRFVFSYLRSPHQPFFFDENGNLNNIIGFNNWQDKKYYLGSYINTTNLIKKAIDSIMLNDPNSIIIVQSDHSARFLVDENNEYVIDVEDKKQILNNVYYMGEDLKEINGQSGVNTLRIVFGKLFNEPMPVLEVPSYGYYDKKNSNQYEE